MSELVKTPYYAYFAAAMGPDGEFDDWSGFAASAVVTSVKEETLAVRNAATAFDLCPMNKYRITGKDAGAMLDFMMTRKISSMQDNRVAYVIWANAKGKLIDDGTVFRFKEDEYMLKCGEDQAEHLKMISEGYDVNINNETTEHAGLSLQGAKSYALLVAAGAKNLENLKAFQLTFDTVGGEDVYISRTGFTGDLGYEVWAKPEQVDAIWKALNSTAITLTPIGMTALDVLRTECCYVIPGYDFGLADTDAEDFERTPAEMDLSWMVNLDREEDFLGKAAIQAEKDSNSSQYAFVAIELEDTSDRGAGSLYETALFNEAGEEIGFITSGGHSYGLQKNIGIASVAVASAAEGSKVLVGEERLSGSIVARPFFSSERRTLTPPAL